MDNVQKHNICICFNDDAVHSIACHMHTICLTNPIFLDLTTITMTMTAMCELVLWPLRNM
jgi:hypothetical protein